MSKKVFDDNEAVSGKKSKSLRRKERKNKRQTLKRLEKVVNSDYEDEEFYSWEYLYEK